MSFLKIESLDEEITINTEMVCAIIRGRTCDEEPLLVIVLDVYRSDLTLRFSTIEERDRVAESIIKSSGIVH